MGASVSLSKLELQVQHSGEEQSTVMVAVLQ